MHLIVILDKNKKKELIPKTYKISNSLLVKLEDNRFRVNGFRD